MTDTRLKNASFAFMIVVFSTYLFVALKSCNGEKKLQPIVIGEKKHQSRTIDTNTNIIPASKIDTINVVKIVYRDRWHKSERIIDSTDFIAYSDTITAAHGTQLQVSFSSKSKVFSLPYLKERDDTTIRITDSVFIEKIISHPAEQPSTFWSDLGKIGGGILGGLLLGIGLR